MLVVVLLAVFHAVVGVSFALADRSLLGPMRLVGIGLFLGVLSLMRPLPVALTPSKRLVSVELSRSLTALVLCAPAYAWAAVHLLPLIRAAGTPRFAWKVDVGAILVGAAAVWWVLASPRYLQSRVVRNRLGISDWAARERDPDPADRSD